MKKIILISIIASSLVSCNDTSRKKVASNISNAQGNTKITENTIKLITEETKTKGIESNESAAPENFEIELENYSIIINDYSALNTIFLENNDTIILDEEMGFNLNEKLIEIKPKNKSDRFSVSVALENNLTVYVGEKQFKDLKKWKKIGRYTELNDSLNYFFTTKSYDREVKEKNLETSFEDIKKETLKLKGEYITKELETVKSLKKLPVEFWISRVYIRITRTTDKGVEDEILIVNNSSWGC